MKHVFVINPAAGKKDLSAEIVKSIENLGAKIDYETYITKKKGDGTTFVKQYLEEHSQEETIRFYACGGDGSLYDVVNGIGDHKNIEIAQVATGTGNDFVKSVGKVEDFQNIEKLINAKTKKIDLLKVNGHYCINIADAGFDGEVGYTSMSLKRCPLFNGYTAYLAATLISLLFKISCWMKVSIDDKVLYEGKTLLAAIANGHTYGGGFFCAPLAKIDDGIIDVCLVKKISRFRIASLIKSYKIGTHISDEKNKSFILYEKCHKVFIETKKNVAYGIDGELFKGKRIEIEILPSFLSFVQP